MRWISFIEAFKATSFASNRQDSALASEPGWTYARSASLLVNPTGCSWCSGSDMFSQLSIQPHRCTSSAQHRTCRCPFLSPPSQPMSKLASFSSRGGNFCTTPLERVSSSSASLAKLADPEVQQLVAPSQVCSSVGTEPPSYLKRTRKTMACKQLPVSIPDAAAQATLLLLGIQTDTLMSVLFVSLLMLFSACRSASEASTSMHSTQQPTAAPWRRWPSLG